MRGVRIAMQIIGVLALAMGLLWIGQGFGIIRWPAESFMIDVRPWAMRGALLAVAGALLLVIGERRR